MIIMNFKFIWLVCRLQNALSDCSIYINWSHTWIFRQLKWNTRIGSHPLVVFAIELRRIWTWFSIPTFLYKKCCRKLCVAKSVCIGQWLWKQTSNAIYKDNLANDNRWTCSCHRKSNNKNNNHKIQLKLKLEEKNLTNTETVITWNIRKIRI